MTPEERDRTMDFITQQQAQFAADIQRLEADLQREHDERIQDKSQIGTAILRLTEIAEIQSRRLDDLEQT